MLNVNFKQIEVFVAVADCRSFTEAANRLYLAQSTVSNHVQALENTLQVSLFQRESKKNIILTEEGQRIYQYAREIIERCTALEDDIARDTRRELLLGASTAPAHGVLPELLCGFMQQMPQCCCTVKKGDSAEIHHLLLSGEIQVGFVGSSDNRQSLTYEKIAEDHLVMITPNTPRYAALQAQGVKGLSLLGEPMIFREAGSATQMRIDNYLTELNIHHKEMQVVAYVSMPEVLKELVARGVGVSILSEMVVRDEERAGKLLVFPLEEQPLKRNIYMAYRKKGPLNQSANAFISFVRNFTCQEIGE